ncbi:MAG: hypothetical protein ABSD69_01010 [Candidatus Levyibacteriota bacterium]|jgi:hypothetical protein
MKNFINNITSDKLAYRGFLISFLLMILTIVYILVNYSNLPPFIPIFNQLPWGNDRLTPTLGIFISTTILGLIFLFNIAFTSIVYSKSPLIARMVAAVTLIIAVMNFLFIIKLITQII